MFYGSMNKPVYIGVDVVNNDAISVVSLHFELERRSKTRDVDGLIGYIDVILIFRYNFRLKTRPDLK